MVILMTGIYLFPRCEFYTPVKLLPGLETLCRRSK